MSGSAPDDSSDDLTEKLLDLLVYAPIGLILDAQTLTPDLARRGRQHTAAARQLGEMAVKRGLRRLDDTRSNQATSAAAPTQARADGAKATHTAKKASAPSGAKKSTAKKASAPSGAKKSTAKKASAPSGAKKSTAKAKKSTAKEASASSGAMIPAVESLAIPEYDLLAASQVVKRLDALTADELEAVRAYESGTRDRRTILHKITRLQA